MRGKFVDVGVPRSQNRNLHFPAEINADDADVVDAGDVNNVGFKFDHLAQNARRVTLKKRIVS